MMHIQKINIFEFNTPALKAKKTIICRLFL